MDICADSLIVEVTGPEVKINSLVEMLTPYGIIEMVRTGLVAMVRGSGHPSPSAPMDWENGEGYEDGYEEEEAEVAAPTLLRM